MDAEFARETLSELIPPGARSKDPQLRWQWFVSIAIGAFALHIAQACGFLVWLGLSGFAMASDVSQQQATLTQIQQGQINREIRDAKRQVCLAQQQRNQAALTSWSGQLAAARGQYYSITKVWPDVQSCEELLVAGGNG